MLTPSDFAKEAGLRERLLRGLVGVRDLGSSLKDVGSNAVGAIGDLARGTKNTFRDAFNTKAVAQAKAPIEALKGKYTTDMSGFLSQLEKVKALEAAQAAARKRLAIGGGVGAGIVGANAVGPAVRSITGQE